MLFNCPMCEKIMKSIFAVVMSALFIVIAGCDSQKEKTSDDSSNPSSSQSDTSLDDTSSDNETSKEIDLGGEFIVTDSVVKQRDDAEEIIYSGNCAQLYNPLKGCVDDAAEKLRQEILNSENTAKNYKITGKTYYVSPSGDDNNDGTSQEKPLRTISAINGLNLKEGDAVLFERGSVFRTAATISTKSCVIYGAYGKGDKPKIYASPIPLADPAVWTPTKTKNVWRVIYPYKEVGGIFFEHGETVGYKRNKLKELANDYDFFHDLDDGILYLRYSGGNPGKIFKSIEASTAIFLFTIPTKAENVTVDNLCLKYTSYMGIHATHADNIRITNCEIGYVGGKNYSVQVRFGNAIEAWGSATNFYIANNWIYQTFDSAITWQGVSGGKYENITVVNNLLEYNNADIEYWDSQEHTIKNARIDGNIMRFTSAGWGTRPADAGIRGIEGSIVGTSLYVVSENVSFSKNIIDSPAREIIKWDYSSEFKNTLTASGNKVYVKNSYRTTDRVLRNAKMSDYLATNLAELKEAIKVFDNSAELYWYE